MFDGSDDSPQVGKKILEKDPACTGSLGIAISEAVRSCFVPNYAVPSSLAMSGRIVHEERSSDKVRSWFRAQPCFDASGSSFLLL